MNWLVLRRTALSGLMSLSAAAGTGMDYQLAPTACDGGGLACSSADYQIDFSVASGQVSVAADYGLRAGFSGQLIDAVELLLEDAESGIALGERSSRQLSVSLRYDDETRGPLAAEFVGWNVQSGPLLFDGAGGLVTAGSVYQLTPGVVRAMYDGFSETLAIQVANVGADDFGIYAADGIADLWQVRYFGEASPSAGPASDTDSDGLSQLQEFAFGTDPTQGSAAAVTWNGGVFLQGGTPTPWMNTTATSFSFRAVFARRRDFVAAGLRYTVEFSGDLLTWRASTATPVLVAQDDEVQAVSVPYPFFVNGKKARFFRVKVQSP